MPYVLVDKVSYRDQSPWPAGADGFGLSLQRRNALAYGNDPINWIAAQPTAAAATSTGGAAPVITLHPASQSVLVAMNTAFSVTATGTGPLQYQWRFNGTNLPGATNSLLPINNVQSDRAGVYQAVVFNAAGSAVSSNATLAVALPPTILTQPASLAVKATSNATFSVTAFSPAPLSYQWRFNGVAIPGATAAAYTVISSTPANAGAYLVVVADSSGPVSSAPATLTVLVDPVIVQQPLSQTVATNGTVTLSVTVTNTANLPIGFRWRRGFSTHTNFVLNAYTCFLTVTNVNAGTSATTANTNWTVVVTNLSLPTGGNLSSNAFLTLLPDTDRDGLPDAFETANSLNPADGADASIDRDGDTFTNGQEFIAGTNPGDTNSYPRIEQIIAGPNLRFNAISNRTYTLQFKTNLNDVAWQKLADVAARPTNWTANALDPVPANPLRVYRLVTPGQP